MGHSARQHRLPCRVRAPLLQRALYLDRTAGGDPGDPDDGGDLPPRRAGGFAPAELSALPLHHGERASSQEPSTTPSLAAARAVATGACSYQSVKSMLLHGLDRQPLEVVTPRPPLEHSNLRGAAYLELAALEAQNPVTSSREDSC